MPELPGVHVNSNVVLIVTPVLQIENSGLERQMAISRLHSELESRLGLLPRLCSFLKLKMIEMKFKNDSTQAQKSHCRHKEINRAHMGD